MTEIEKNCKYVSSRGIAQHCDVYPPIITSDTMAFNPLHYYNIKLILMSLSFCLKARKWYDKHLVKFGGDISYDTLQKLVPEKNTEKHDLTKQNAVIKF